MRRTQNGSDSVCWNTAETLGVPGDCRLQEGVVMETKRHTQKKVRVGGFEIGGGAPLTLIAGPCVIESEAIAMQIAEFLKKLSAKLEIPFIFKASYDKANRTSHLSFRGPGLIRGLEILRKIREELDIPVLSDVHRFEEISPAAEVLDVMQVPAFLCRQTDFIMEIARQAKVVNVKKGQFIAPWDAIHIADKAAAAGNDNVLLTERGACFGYNNLVVDFRSLPTLRETGYPVIFDATHSVQLPGAVGNASGGDRRMVPYLARAAVAAGVDGLFFEVHPDPDRALSDGPNSLALESLPGLLTTLKKIDDLVRPELSW
jgi:2-dehydro-3-deoxyphosphooctonate aldolase (KDO 8-P synthase)